MSDTYHVFRRSDGYVGCVAGQPPRNGRDTFEILLTTPEWTEARDMLVMERDDRHRALVASWIPRYDSREAILSDINEWRLAVSNGETWLGFKEWTMTKEV